MSLNYINGVQVGLEIYSGTPSYAPAALQFRRLVYLFLTHVVGWTDKDKSGTKWDNPVVTAKTDGVTDSSDPTKFTSATGNFISNSVAAGDLLMVTSGFSDSTRKGFYNIKRIDNATTLYVDAWHGVHSDGLPLSQTGVTYEIHRFHTIANCPAIGDWFVVEGTGAGGAFDLRNVVDASVSYMPERWDISPYDDWNATTHAWKTGPTRYSGQSQIAQDYSACVGWVWGIADMTHAIFWVKYYTDAMASIGNPMVFYFGDITPFHTEDTNPVISALGRSDGNWNELIALQGVASPSNIWMVAGDNTQSLGRLVYLSESADSSIAVVDGVNRNRSWYSKKYERFPLIVASEVSGKEEIRGQLKDFRQSHQYGPRACTPIGSARDYLKLGYSTIPWNGSKQNRYLY